MVLLLMCLAVLTAKAVAQNPLEPRQQDQSPDWASGVATNLTITSAQIIDGAFNPITPQVGVPFFIQANFNYIAPTDCTSYQLSREVNGWLHEAAPINWGCDTGGGVGFFHASGSMVLFESGNYSAAMSIDVQDAIAEANEGDNTFVLNFTVVGADIEPPEWQLTEVAAGRALLGEGTDVIVGTMDDAFDFLHPWYDGNDSLGRPRLVASSQNTLGVGGSPVNQEHATRVMGATLAKPVNAGDMTGYAPDARYVTAEFLNRAGTPGLPVLHVLDAAGFLVDHGVDVVNASWSFWFGSVADSESGESVVTNLMVDYMAYGENIVMVPAVNQLPNERPTAPGSSRNVITVGGLEDDLQRAWVENDHGPTLDGRSKPDLLGNDSVNVPQAWMGWRIGVPAIRAPGGTSAAAPHVTGAAAQLIGYGKANGENLDQKVIRSVLTNSGVKAQDADGSPWSNAGSAPLDNEQGSGILSVTRAHAMYSGGQWEGTGHVPSYDLATVTGAVDGPGLGTRTYLLGSPSAPTDLDITLVFDRHTLWDDVDADGSISEGDTFFVSPSDVQDNLDIVVLKDGVEIASSRSLVDTTEHIHIGMVTAGVYELRVERLDVANSGTSEEFALAIYSSGNWSASDNGIFADGFESGDAALWQ